ncbi:MAG: hypothetical protein J6R66_04155 [Clostridia bacterium]|nr:hypothetical protein [Clostridia bacterium]
MPCCKTNCSALAILASVIVGIVTAFLRITATITLTPAFLWVTLGVAVAFLVIALATSASTQGASNRGCFCPILSLLLTGALGAILTSVVLLAITFAATSIIGAIITGALLGFVSLIFTETACLAKCLARCNSAD